MAKDSEPAWNMKDSHGNNTNAGSDIECTNPSHIADLTPVTTKPVTTPEVIKSTAKPHTSP